MFGTGPDRSVYSNDENPNDKWWFTPYFFFFADYPRESRNDEKPTERQNAINEICEKSNLDRKITRKTNVCQDKASDETNVCQTMSETSRNEIAGIRKDKCDKPKYDKYSFYDCLVQTVCHTSKQPSNREYFVHNDGEKCKNEL